MRAVRLLFTDDRLRSAAWLRDTARLRLLLFIAFLIPGTPKDLLTYAVGLTACPMGQILLITTVGRVPSIATSTLAAGFAAGGNWSAAAISLAVAAVLAGAGSLLYRRFAR